MPTNFDGFKGVASKGSMLGEIEEFAHEARMLKARFGTDIQNNVFASHPLEKFF